MSHWIRSLVGVWLAIGLAAPANAAGEFQYAIPAGWLDLRAAIMAASRKDTSKVPQRLLQDAGSGRFAVVAIDPSGTTNERAGATFNAVEMQGTGRVTSEVVSKGGAELVAQLEASGIGASLIEATLIKLNGVNVGMTTVDMDIPQGTRRLRQYLIPGRKSATVLSFAAPKADFDRYLPVFEASARATQGGFDSGSIDWKRVFVNGGIGALFFGAAGFFISYMRKRRGADAEGEADGTAQSAASTPRARSTPTPKKTSQYVWTCPGCGNPVPARIEQCRCGTAKAPR